MNANNDINILALDRKIKQTFRKKHNTLRDMRARLIELRKTWTILEHTPVNTNLLQTNINTLEEGIRDIECQTELSLYTLKTCHLINRYKQLLDEPISVTFMGKQKKIDKSRHTKIIHSFIQIANNYLNTPIIIKQSPTLYCNNCDSSSLYNMDDAIYMCKECGSQQEMLLSRSTYNDGDRVNISSKYSYIRKVHFRDCLHQYQGKQNSNIPDNVYSDLRSEIKKNNMLVGADTDPDIKRYKKVTKKNIRFFLQGLGYPKHYKNIHLIHYNITKQRPDDIAHLEYKLLHDFDKLTEFYDKTFKNKPGFERKSFINTQYVLYQLLLKHNHKCNKSDFSMLTTSDLRDFHDDIVRTCFMELGWNHFQI